MFNLFLFPTSCGYINNLTAWEALWLVSFESITASITVFSIARAQTFLHYFKTDAHSRKLEHRLKTKNTWHNINYFTLIKTFNLTSNDKVLQSIITKRSNKYKLLYQYINTLQPFLWAICWCYNYSIIYHMTLSYSDIL